MWTWTAFDADSRLIVSWIVGGRDADTANQFIDDLQSRLANGVQLTRNGYVGESRQLVKEKSDPKHLSRSSAERHKLTMRTKNRTWRLDNHRHGLALYFFWYNWCRINKASRVSPAIAAGLTDKLMGIADIANMVEIAAPKPGFPRRQGPGAERAERKRLAALARIEATEINPIELIIREEWTVPADLLPERLAGFANELRTRIKAGQTRERLYLRAAFVQVHVMQYP